MTAQDAQNTTANKVSAQNGISRLQRDILQVLAGQSRPVPPSVIHAALNQDRPTPSQRVALSKSLNRLMVRGLVWGYNSEICRAGKGWLYGLPMVPGGE